MMQSEFLDFRRRVFERGERNKRIKRLLVTLMLLLVTFALAMGVVHAVEASQFDYDACDHIVAKGNLDTAPLPADHEWKEIITTPGGNWCVIFND
jgi:hypothetical protein